MKDVASLAVALIIFVLAVPVLLPFVSADVRAAAYSNAIELGRFLVFAAKGAFWIGVGLAVLKGAHMLRDLFLIRPKNGLYPGRWGLLAILWHRGADNEEGAQRVAALTSGSNENLRFGGAGSALKQILPEPETPLLAEPEQPLMLTAGEAVDVDPVTRPHWLIVGQTGSGKSTATRYIMSQLAQRYPCEFVICEPGGIDWNRQAAAYSEEGIAQAIGAVHAEFTRRQELLRSADVQHINELEQRLPYIYLVCEEMDSMFDNLRHVDRARALEARGQLRDMARMGRKPGVCLVTVATSATADLFDAAVKKSLANVLLFRNTLQVAYAFGVDADLTALPTGTAYSVAHGRIVQFPQMARPNVPVSGLYRELPGTTAALPGTTESDYSATTTGDYSAEDAISELNEGASSGVVSSSGVVESRAEWERRAWAAYLEGGNVTAAQRIMYPGQQEGGQHWKDIDALVKQQMTLQARIARRL